MKNLMKALSLFVLSVAAISPAHAQTNPPAVSASDSAAIEKLAKPILDALIKGDTKVAVDSFVAGSPLMAGKTTELTNLQAQFQNGLTLYGKISRFDLAQEDRYGQFVVRRYYVAAQANYLTRWEFVFGRSGEGWTVTYLGFDDQIRSWLK
jgi:hypothetical protein